MRKKLRLFSSVAIIIVVILSMASCAKSADPNSSNTESQAVGNSNQTDNITDTDKISTHYNISEKYTWDDFNNFAIKNCEPETSYNVYFYRYLYLDDTAKYKISDKHSGDYDYSVYENGKALLDKYTGTDSSVRIPAAIDGYEVIGIGSYCFSKPEEFLSIYKNHTLKEVTFDSDCKLIYIADSAFENCVELKNISLPTNILAIDGSAFEGCTSLQSVNLPERLVCIGGGAFYGCTSLKKVIIPDSVVTLKNSVFYNCNNLESVELSDNIDKTYGNTFYHCYKLSKINVPKKLKIMYRSDFEGTKIDTSVFEKAGVEIR